MILDRFRVTGRAAVVTGAGRGHRRGRRGRPGRGRAPTCVISARTEDQLAKVRPGDRGRRPPRRGRARRPERPGRGGRAGRGRGRARSAGWTSWSTTSAARCRGRSSTPQPRHLAGRLPVQRGDRAQPHPGRGPAPAGRRGPRHDRAVINISSAVGRVAGRGYLAYGTAKAALAHYTRLAAADLAPRIRVNAHRRRLGGHLRAGHRAHRRRPAQPDGAGDAAGPDRRPGGDRGRGRVPGRARRPATSPARSSRSTAASSRPNLDLGIPSL